MNNSIYIEVISKDHAKVIDYSEIADTDNSIYCVDPLSLPSNFPSLLSYILSYHFYPQLTLKVNGIKLEK